MQVVASIYFYLNKHLYKLKKYGLSYLVDFTWIGFNIYWLLIINQWNFIIKMSFIVKKSFNYELLLTIMVI